MKKLFNIVLAWAMVFSTIGTIMPTVFALPASIMFVEKTGPTSMTLMFSEQLTGDGALAALEPSNYTLSGGLTVLDVNADSQNNTMYFVYSSGEITPYTHTLTVNSLAGQNSSLTAQNIIDPTDIVISEVSTEYGGGFEFVEIYNKDDSPSSISGFQLQYKQASGGGWSTIATVPDATMISGYGFYLFATGTVNGTTPDVTFSTVLDNTAGNVRLYNPIYSQALDTVGYGSTADSYEGYYMLAPNAGSSIERKAFGVSKMEDMASGGIDANKGNSFDSGDNGLDFVPQSSPLPQNSASAVEDSTITGYEGAAANGCMINHMPISVAPSGYPLYIYATIGNSGDSAQSIAPELHYMVGDGSTTNNTPSNYSVIVGEDLGNGSKQFVVPQTIIDSSTTNGFYYYLKCISVNDTSFMSASPNADMSGDELTVAQYPFVTNIQNPATWTVHNITGRVIDGTSMLPVANSLVSLSGSSYSATTGGDGTFTLSPMSKMTGMILLR